VRTTVTIDDDAYEAASTLAKASGRRLGEVISQLIRRAVQPSGAPPKRRRRQLPAFEVARDTPPISLRAIRRAWEEM
jgi:uncharacterized protein YggE